MIPLRILLIVRNLDVHLCAPETMDLVPSPNGNFGNRFGYFDVRCACEGLFVDVRMQQDAAPQQRPIGAHHFPGVGIVIPSFISVRHGDLEAENRVARFLQFEYFNTDDIRTTSH